MSYYWFDSSVKVHYQLTVTDSNNPVILLLHGFMGNCNNFQACIPSLCQSFCCLTVDLPGHGKTQVSGDESYYTISKTATILIGLLKYLSLSKVCLCGYSMGGRLALYLMIHYPQYFERVILESASPGLRNSEARLQRLQVDLERAKQLENQDFKQFLIDWYNQPLFYTLKKHSKFNQILDCRLQNNPNELAKSLRNMGIGIQPSLWDRLADNQIPVLLIVGELDHKFIQINQEVASLLTGSRLQVITGCGHNIHLENQKIWIQVVLEFVGV